MKTYLHVALPLALCASAARADVIYIPPAPNVSPAASFAQSGQANVHLSSSSAATSATDTTTTSRPAWARFASGTGNLLYLGAGTLLPLIEDGKNKKEHTLRAADSLLTSTLITEALKRIVREKRPDSNERTSFPSGHATAAFAIATMQASFHPKQAILWYAGATAIAASRVKLRRHYTQDVLAGAAIGFVTARLELKQPRGLLLAPFIRGSRRQSVTGVSMGGTF